MCCHAQSGCVKALHHEHAPHKLAMLQRELDDELTSCLVLQNEELYASMRPVAAGKNGLVFSWVNPFWPNVVLKKSYKAAIEQEAEMLQAVRHPNIVSVAAVSTTVQTMPDDKPAAFLALHRLGTPLVDVTRYRPWLPGSGFEHGCMHHTYLSLPCICAARTTAPW